jgi:hypothetical protein
MRFFNSTTGKAKIADAENHSSACGGQKKKSWAAFRLFMGKKKSTKSTVDERQAEFFEKIELENRILKWLNESSREDIIEPELNFIENSCQTDASSASEDTGISTCQTQPSGDIQSSKFSSEKLEDSEDNTPSLEVSAQSTPSVNVGPKPTTCLMAPRREILRPCNFQQGLRGLMSDGMIEFPSRLNMNGGLNFADSFRSLAAPLCGGAR